MTAEWQAVGVWGHAYDTQLIWTEEERRQAQQGTVKGTAAS